MSCGYVRPINPAYEIVAGLRSATSAAFRTHVATRHFTTDTGSVGKRYVRYFLKAPLVWPVDDCGLIRLLPLMAPETWVDILSTGAGR